MHEHFMELIINIIKHHSKDELVNIFSKCGMTNYIMYLKYEHLPFNRVIENTIKKFVIDIMENKVAAEVFYTQFDCMNKIVFDCLFTNVFNIPFYWDNEKDKISTSYKNLGC